MPATTARLRALGDAMREQGRVRERFIERRTAEYRRRREAARDQPHSLAARCGRRPPGGR